MGLSYRARESSVLAESGIVVCVIKIPTDHKAELNIMHNYFLGKNCTRNPQGTFYLGDMYTEANGENCTEGGIFTYYLSDFTCDAYGYKSKDTPSCGEIIYLFICLFIFIPSLTYTQVCYLPPGFSPRGRL